MRVLSFFSPAKTQDESFPLKKINNLQIETNTEKSHIHSPNKKALNERKTTKHRMNVHYVHIFILNIIYTKAMVLTVENEDHQNAMQTRSFEKYRKSFNANGL